jgi:dolichol-phosphate mannosyltransferase
MEGKILVLLPTYNERGNIERLYEEIRGLGLPLDILFVDDNSPDGTGAILDGLSLRDRGVFVIHRPGKLGVGSAHKDGIRWAYDHGYPVLITMDSDFTHSPHYILELLKKANNFHVIVGSRFMLDKSLEGWIWWRKLMTHLGHFLTRHLLHIEFDATGALRLYRLDKIPKEVFGLIQSPGYPFFFESLALLHLNGCAIEEIPVLLPPRTYGSSKMKVKDMLQCLAIMVTIRLGLIFAREKFRIMKAEPVEPVGISMNDGKLG